MKLKRLALNLELPPPERAAHWLAHLRAQQLIFDPEPARVLLVAGAGLAGLVARSSGRCQWLVAATPGRGFPSVVCPSGADASSEGQLQCWERLVQALSEPLVQEMASSPTVGVEPSGPAIAYWPGWSELVIDDPAAGLLRAGWLQAAASGGHDWFVQGLITALLIGISANVVPLFGPSIRCPAAELWRAMLAKRRWPWRRIAPLRRCRIA